MNLREFITNIPKAELHLHIEGTFEPELMFQIAQRNNIELKYASVEELKKAYDFSNLQDFLDIYYEGANVLIHEQDFYDLTWAYMEKIAKMNVLHIEIFFDPQTHTERGIAFETAFNGIKKALDDAKAKLNVSSEIIMCFLRHLDEDSAFKTLEQALPFKKDIIGVGLDSSELGHPPSKFERVFKKAQEEGFLTVAHAGEEGPAEYIWEALNLLNISRIDHGNRCLDDDKLVDEIAKRQIPLTLCPLSNLKLKVVNDLAEHPLKKMLQKNLMVTINSDDPAYFGGQVDENFLQLAEAIDLSKEDVYKVARNSFLSSFIEDTYKTELLEKIDSFYKTNA